MCECGVTHAERAPRVIVYLGLAGALARGCCAGTSGTAKTSRERLIARKATRGFKTMLVGAQFKLNPMILGSQMWSVSTTPESYSVYFRATTSEMNSR